jgi:hypothetical protein
MPVVDGLPVPVGGRQVPPRRPCPSPPEHSVDHLPVIGPVPASSRRPVRQQRRQPIPLGIGQIMTIMYQLWVTHLSIKIRQTRSDM